MQRYRVRKPESTICGNCKREYPTATHCDHNVNYEEYPRRHGLNTICANCKWFAGNVKNIPYEKGNSGTCYFKPPDFLW